MLWTRRPFSGKSQARLTVEVSKEETFTALVVTASANVLAAADWTCRVLVGNLQPSRLYWYRFIDGMGNASRTGRTRTAPATEDDRPLKFAFACCQNLNLGVLNAYRRMIFEDVRAPDSEKIEFVLHLGDFIYETQWYAEDNPNGHTGRPVHDVIRYPRGETISLGADGTVHIPAEPQDYRRLYRAYLQDPDLQDARARWPFICMWDNEEFSDAGWQGMQVVDGKNRPAQVLKVAALQAWFEYQPARVKKSSGPSLDQFNPPHVRNIPVTRFDEHGFGEEPNNRAAVGSLTGYRALLWGRNLEILLTDQRSYRSRSPFGWPEMEAFADANFPELVPQEVLEILDAGRAYAGGKPPATIRFGDKEIPNFSKDEPPQTILGVEQKAWFLRRLKESTATWKVWGNSVATLDQRADPQNLPAGHTKPWPGAGYAGFPMSDYATAYTERSEIYRAVRDAGITGFAIFSGNSHSFWAGLAAPALPPQPFEPVGVAFVTAALSSPASAERLEFTMQHDHPLYGLFLARGIEGAKPQPAINMLLRHGVRSCLEYQRTGDAAAARKLSNLQLAPHLSFLDLSGNGYATVHVSSAALECEFVCIPPPIERSAGQDGGPLVYRIVHRVALWRAGENPRLEQRVVEGNPMLSL